jgi:hypothetical protein
MLTFKRGWPGNESGQVLIGSDRFVRLVRLLARTFGLSPDKDNRGRAQATGFKQWDRYARFSVRRNGAAKRRNAKVREALDKYVDDFIRSQSAASEQRRWFHCIVEALWGRPPPQRSIPSNLKYALETGDHVRVARYLQMNPGDQRVELALADSLIRQPSNKSLETAKTRWGHCLLAAEIEARCAQAAASGQKRILSKQVWPDVASRYGLSLRTVASADKWRKTRAQDAKNS